MDKKLSLLIILNIAMLVFTSFALPYRSDKKLKTGLKNGNIAPEIVLTNPEGGQVPLSSLRGKMVYIDFWASWCKGCRTVNKNLKSIYEKYKDEEFINGKGFQVYSVSLDIKLERWLNAIEADSIQCFVHVSDLKGWESPVAIQFKANGLPHGYLIDGNGVIINYKSGFRKTMDKLLITDDE